MRIGVIGAGRIGSTVGGLWAKAGHQVRFGSRDPSHIMAQAAELGASAGTQEEAAEFGEAVFAATPYGLWPDLAARIAGSVAGKLVMDAANPYPQRDGRFAQAALDARQGSGVPVARLLPDTHYVRAFNSVYWETLASEAGRVSPRLAIPLVGDDQGALDMAASLVSDAGFDPVFVGPLIHAATFDVGTPAYNNPQTRDELERLLGLIPPG